MSRFDEQVKNTTAPDGCTLQNVYDFVKDIYDFRIPENAEEGNLPFGVIDYYNMENLGAWLKQTEAELARKDAAIEAARVALQVTRWDLQLKDDGDVFALCAGCGVDRDDVESGADRHEPACVVNAALAALEAQKGKS